MFQFSYSFLTKSSLNQKRRYITQQCSASATQIANVLLWRDIGRDSNRFS